VDIETRREGAWRQHLADHRRAWGFVVSTSALKRAVTRLIKAEVAASWLGLQDYEDHPQIKQELALARKRYEEALAKLRVSLADANLS